MEIRTDRTDRRTLRSRSSAHYLPQFTTYRGPVIVEIAHKHAHPDFGHHCLSVRKYKNEVRPALISFTRSRIAGREFTDPGSSGHFPRKAINAKAFFPHPLTPLCVFSLERMGKR